MMKVFGFVVEQMQQSLFSRLGLFPVIHLHLHGEEMGLDGGEDVRIEFTAHQNRVFGGRKFVEMVNRESNRSVFTVGLILRGGGGGGGGEKGRIQRNEYANRTDGTRRIQEAKQNPRKVSNG